MNRSLVLAVMAPFLVGASAAGQESSSAVQETAEVVLVEVPVRVTGRDGAPVRNLTPADFQLYDDGKKQEIVGFDVIDLAEKGPATPGQELNPAARRRFLLLFDLSFSRPKALLEARGAAKEFVLSGMRDADLAAVATFSLDTGLRLIVNFSSDRVQLARGIDTLGLVTSLAKEKDPLQFAYDVTMLQRTVGSTGGSGHRAAADAALVETLETFRALGRASQDRYARARIGDLFLSFDHLAVALDLVGGRKDIIYLSEGFESRLLVGTRETEQEKEWIITGDQWKIDSDRRFGNSAMQTRLDQMTALFRRSDCVIHAVDLSGIRTDADVTSVTAASTENSLFEFAQGTGGEVLHNANDFRKDLSDVIRRTNLVYVLAFRPTRTGGEGKFHELKVKVHASGARVSARAGYYERKGFKQLSPLEQRLLTADVIANEIPMEEIPTRVLATAFATGQETAAVPVLIEIPGEKFLAGEKGERTTAEIYVYADDHDNRLRDFFVQTVGLDLSKSRERLLAGGLKYYGELRLPAGDYRLRTLVRNADTGRMGLNVFSLHVPSFAPGEPYLLPPVFLESPGNWMSVGGRGKSASGGIDPASYPFLSLGAENMWPAALPQVRPGDASRVCLVAYHFGAAGSGELRLGSQILASDGQPVKEGTLAVLGKSAPELDGKRMLLLSFTTPQGLAPGRYGLRIFLQDPTTGQARQASAPFVVP